jgi:hypothetical protein
MAAGRKSRQHRFTPIMTTLYIATASGLHSLGAAPQRELEDRDVRALHVEPSGRRWAIVDESELWRDAGTGWEMASQYSDGRLNCVSVHDGDVWVGASEARLLLLEGGGLKPRQEFDEAPGREDWFTPWGGPPDVRSLASNDGYLFANVHVGGILRKDPGVDSWRPTIPIDSDVHEVVTDPRNGTALAATARGLALSHDLGETWEFDVDGLHSSYSRALAVGAENLFMSAANGPFGGPAALYRRRLDGPGFVKCEGGLPEWFDDNIDSGCLALEGQSVAFGTQDGRVFVSSDEGESWEEVASGLAPVRWVELAGP